ncbi:MAG: CAP domain-containing protein, partial [Clostridia bacterium]|nr:CAP domain-containing protein [Clostridia bacterium]
SPYFETSDGLKYGDKTNSGEKEYETLRKDGALICKFNEKSENYLYGVEYLAEGYDNSGFYDMNYLLSQQSRLGTDVLNSYRYRKGKNVLLHDENAAQSCTGHAKYMAETENLTHTGEYSSTGIQRYLYYNPGYKWTSWGENICAGAKNAFICMNGWRNSERHKKILLSDNSFCGLGMYYDGNSKYKYTAAMLIFK